MNNPFCLPFINKLLVATPIVLLLACDGGRGHESLIAFGTALALSISLTWLEGYYVRSASFRQALLTSICCAGIGITLMGIELICFASMEKLRRPIGAYGIIPTLIVLSVVFFLFAYLSAWNDTRRK